MPGKIIIDQQIDLPEGIGEVNEIPGNEISLGDVTVTVCPYLIHAKR